MQRREFISALASAALPGSWNAGETAHILPTANDRRMLIKASFRVKQKSTWLKVGSRLVAGKQTDKDGRFWAYDADQLQPARPYELQLLNAAKKQLCDPWTLKTLPDPSDRPASFRLLVYTCAGGDERLISRNGGNKGYLTNAQRGALLDRALSFQPDAVIANGDHIYWDLRQSTFPKKYTPEVVAKIGQFVRDQPVLGTPNEEVLQHVGDQQIASLYGTRMRGLPVFFLQDDHDYFENDDADEQMVTYPPDHFMLQLARATRRMYYPEFLPDANRPLGLPGAAAADTPIGTAESFGTLRFGRLSEVLLYDCRRYLTLAGQNAVVVPREVESWITRRITDESVTHTVQLPSQPPGWSAGKWGDWYPDILAADGTLTIQKPKPYWQEGWALQHDRLMKAASDQRTKVPMFVSGDMHSIAEGRILKTGKLDLRQNAPVSIIPGPIGTGTSWPSAARGVRAVPPHHIEMEEKLPCLEENGFTLLEFTSASITAKYFRWRPSAGDASIASLAPFLTSQFARPS